MRSPEDSITITSEGGRAFDRWTSCEILNSIIRSSEASFEVGDDGSWEALSSLAALGTRFTVQVNGKVRVTGKVEVLNSPLDATRSSTVRFVVRTALSQIESDSASLRIQQKANPTIKQIIEQALGLAGIPANMIEYRTDVARNLFTGAPTRGGRPRRDLDQLKEDQASSQPGETLKAFLDRHLMRHGLLIWDGPDGKVVVGAPDDDQEESYTFRCFRGAEGKFNNVVSIERMRDASSAPTQVMVFGFGGKREYAKAKVAALRENPELITAGFLRRHVIVDDGVKTKELAERTAARAFSERTRRQDCFVIGVDGLAYRERSARVPYAPDTTCFIMADTIGGAVGKFYLEQTLLRRSPTSGDTTELQAVKAGTWVL